MAEVIGVAGGSEDKPKDSTLRRPAEVLPTINWSREPEFQAELSPRMMVAVWL